MKKTAYRILLALMFGAPILLPTFAFASGTSISITPTSGDEGTSFTIQVAGSGSGNLCIGWNTTEPNMSAFLSGGNISILATSESFPYSQTYNLISGTNGYTAKGVTSAGNGYVYTFYFKNSINCTSSSGAVGTATYTTANGGGGGGAVTSPFASTTALGYITGAVSSLSAYLWFILPFIIGILVALSALTIGFILLIRHTNGGVGWSGGRWTYKKWD